MNVNLEVTDEGALTDKLEDENSWDLYSSSFALRPMPVQFLFLNPEWYGWIDSEEISTVQDKVLNADSQEEAQTYSDEFHEVFWEHLPIITPGDSTQITSMREGVDGYQFVSGPILWNVSVDD